MKLFSATALAASLLSYINACQSPLSGGSGPDCHAYKKGKFEATKCSSKGAMKLIIKGNGKMCMKSRCLMVKEKNGKLIFKMGSKKGTPLKFKQVQTHIVVTSPDELKGQFPRFENGKIKFNADVNKGVIRCSIPTTPAPTTPEPTTTTEEPTTPAPTTTTPEPTTPTPTTPAPTTKKANDYHLYFGGCLPYSDRWPTVNHPQKAIRRHVFNGVFYNNFYVIAGQSVASCKVLCDREPWCIGFEYAAHPQPNWISFKAFVAGDCQLNFHDARYTIIPKCEGWALSYFRKLP